MNRAKLCWPLTLTPTTDPFVSWRSMKWARAVCRSDSLLSPATERICSCSMISKSSILNRSPSLTSLIAFNARFPMSIPQADLALGVVMDTGTIAGLQRESLGTARFAFVVAPHHPLARAPEPLSDEVIRRHRAVALADSTQRGDGISFGLLAGQDVLTVTSMPTKLDAQVRGLGTGFLPTCLAQPYIDTGRLVVKRVERAEQQIQVSYAWRKSGKREQGRALQWWLAQLQRRVTRAALLGERGVRADKAIK